MDDLTPLCTHTFRLIVHVGSGQIHQTAAYYVHVVKKTEKGWIVSARTERWHSTLQTLQHTRGFISKRADFLLVMWNTRVYNLRTTTPNECSFTEGYKLHSVDGSLSLLLRPSEDKLPSRVSEPLQLDDSFSLFLIRWSRSGNLNAAWLLTTPLRHCAAVKRINIYSYDRICVTKIRCSHTYANVDWSVYRSVWVTYSI